MIISEIPQTKEGILLITERPTDMEYPEYRTQRVSSQKRLRGRIDKGIKLIPANEWLDYRLKTQQKSSLRTT